MSILSIRFAGVLLVVGMLLFPAAALAAPDVSAPTVHVVQWGETLSTIAIHYGVTVEAILVANELHDPDFVYVGQKLVIPMQGGYGGPSKKPVAPDYGGGMCTNTYKVRYGDTLSGIALQYGTTANVLMQTNNLRSDFIYEGQKLCVPASGSGMAQQPSMSGGQVEYHTVRAGDTLAGIALRYGVTQAAIVQANNLSNPSLIYVGQSLIIPGAKSQVPMAPKPMPGQEPMQPPGYSPGQGGAMGGQSPQGQPGQAPMAPGYSPGQGGAVSGQPPQGQPSQAPTAPGYSPGQEGSMGGQPPQGTPGEAPMPPGYQHPSQTAPPPEYQPAPAVATGYEGVVRAEPMWTGSQIAHSADPDEITTLLVLVEEGNEGLDVMIRSKDGFAARGVTAVFYEYSWLPNFAFRHIPGGEYEIWIDGEKSRVIKAEVDPGWRATVDLKHKIVTPGAVVSPDGWVAEVVDNSNGSDPIGAASILVVKTGGIGNKIRLTAPGQFEAVCVTGTKPEHGVGACDFGGLSPGTYWVTLDGTYATVEIYVDGVGTAEVHFRRASTHEMTAVRLDP